MPQLRTLLQISCYVFALIGCMPVPARAQDKSIPVQHILFRNNVLAENLTAFFDFTQTQSAYLHISRHVYDSVELEDSIIYKLEETPPYVDYIEEYSPTAWAEWQGHIVLIHIEDNIVSDQVYSITDKTTYANLVKYAHCTMSKLVLTPLTDTRTKREKELSKQRLHHKPVKKISLFSPESLFGPPPLFHGVYWVFKVIKGKVSFINSGPWPTHDEYETDFPSVKGTDKKL